MSGASGKVAGQGAGERIREPLPVEALLQWAYGEQMVHLARREAVVTRSKGPLAAYSTLWSEGATPIDSSSDQGFRASDDAWVIHGLVQALKPVRLDLGQDLAAARYHALGQYRGAAPPVGNTGNADRTAQPWPTNGLLEIDVPTLVMVHANRGTRPQLLGDEPLRLKNGGLVRHPRRRDRAYVKGWYCHVVAEGDLPGEVRAAAETYRVWWEALDGVRRRLQAIRLTMFNVTTGMPPAPKKPG